MYKIDILRRAVKDIARLPGGYTRLVTQHIRDLAENPRPHDAKKLHGSDEYSLRVGIYRVIYTIDEDAAVITIFRVKHRREAYR